jgi:enterochelin esterase family protein
VAAADGNAVLTFELLDPRGGLRGVRLLQEVGLPEPLEFSRVRHRWRLEVPRSDVDRMEYLFEIEDRRGRHSMVLDPTNPQRVGGAFGDKSVREFPGYRPPAWLDTAPVAAREQQLTVAAAGLDADIEVTVWSPADLADDQPAPLVVVHDGPQFARLGGITHFLGAGMATSALPRVRAALVDPGDRNAWYAANPRYAEALCADVVAALDERVPATVRVGVGASLGALALLHAHRRHPDIFGALLLQSGSFFTPASDGHESEFPGWAATTGFVTGVAADASSPHRQGEAPVPTVLTCGTVEENLANNRAMTEHLRRLGYPAELVVVRDAHNYTAWRDALDPSLTRLIEAAVERPRAA